MCDQDKRDGDQNKCGGHVVKCGRCEGTGREMGLLCPTCSGVGSVLLK
jgi:DnaJ-class molecular chaperone